MMKEASGPFYSGDHFIPGQDLIMSGNDEDFIRVPPPRPMWLQLAPYILSFIGLAPVAASALGLVSGDHKALVLCSKLSAINTIHATFQLSLPRLDGKDLWHVLTAALYGLCPVIVYGCITWKALTVVESMKF